MWRNGRSLFPGLAVAEVLRARGHEVMLFVSEKEIDALALAGAIEFRFERLPTVGLPSPFSPAIFGFSRRFNESLSLCRAIYRKFKPQVVLGMGGFTSTAPILAGRMRGIPTFIHESNAIPGKGEPYDRANGACGFARIQRVRALFSQGAHGSDRHAHSHRTQTRWIERKRATKLGLHEDLRTLLVMGGSQGASRDQSGHDQINALAARDCRLQVIHLSGVRDERLVADNYLRENIPAYVARVSSSRWRKSTARPISLLRAPARPVWLSWRPFALPAHLDSVSLRGRRSSNAQC